MTTSNLTLTINDKRFSGTVDNRTLLLDFIRNSADLTGAKRGCNEGKCGACTVIADGVPVKSCNVLAVSANGSEILTVEGLSDGATLHQIQESFHRNHGLQCGFCTSGFLMMAKHLLDIGFEPDPIKIRGAVHGNICRCTGYQKIIESLVEVLQGTEPAQQGANSVSKGK